MPFGSLINTASGNSTATGTTVSTSTSLTVSVGDLVVVSFGVRSGGISSVTFSDNLSNTWTNLTNTGNVAAGVFAAFTLVTAAGSMTPKATYASTGQAQVIVAGQYSGPFAASPLDQNPACITSTSTGTVSGPATGTLAQASELIVAYMEQANGNATQTAGTGLSLDLAVTAGSGTKPTSDALEHEVVSSTASTTPQWGNITASNSGYGVATFKAGGDVLQSQILM